MVGTGFSPTTTLVLASAVAQWEHMEVTGSIPFLTILDSAAVLLLIEKYFYPS